MNKSKIDYWLILALLLYFLLWIFGSKYWGYLLDTDATAYLSIAEKISEGKINRGINGLWSPLNIWLLIPFIKMGFSPWLVAKFLNFLIGFLVIKIFWTLQENLKIEKIYKAMNAFVLPIILCYYAYFQIFGDLLQVFFLLGYMHICLQNDFVHKPKKIIWAAFWAALAFYAKAYTFVFFILHITFIFFLAYRNEVLKKSLIKNYFLAITVFVLAILPWSLLLSQKYGGVNITGNAGKLNLSWYIESGKSFKPDIHLLIPPAYPDAVSFWEDPYLSQDKLIRPFTSLHHFKKWILRVGHTGLIAIRCHLEISIFSIFMLAFFLWHGYKKKSLDLRTNKILGVIFLLPLGYLAMHIETRYLWLSTFMLLLLVPFFISKIYFRNKSYKKIFILFLSLSFILYPIFDLYKLRYKNKNLFETAAQLSFLGKEINVCTNLKDEGAFWVISYLNCWHNFTIENENFSYTELLTEMKRYKVDTYIHFYNEAGVEIEDSLIRDENLKVEHHFTEKFITVYKLH